MVFEGVLVPNDTKFSYPSLLTYPFKLATKLRVSVEDVIFELEFTMLLL